MKAAVSVARPPAATLGEQHQRQSQLARELKHPIFLAMVLMPLRAGQHRVVVRHDDGARLVGAEQISIDSRKPGDEPVSRRVFDQVVLGAPAPLRRHDNRPVLDERARIAQLVDILARRPLPRLAPTRHRVGPRRVEPDFVPLEHLRQVRAHTFDVFSSRPHVRNIARMRVKRKTLLPPAPID